MPTEQLEENGVVECSKEHSSCHINTAAPPRPDYKFTWTVYFDHPDAIKFEQGDYDPAKTIGVGTNEFTVEKETVVLQVPEGESAHIGITPPAVVVPGVYQDCSDGQTYDGEVTIPMPKAEYHLVRTNTAGRRGDGDVSQGDSSADKRCRRSPGSCSVLPTVLNTPHRSHAGLVGAWRVPTRLA